MANQKEMSRKTAEMAAWLGLLMIAAAMLFYDAQTPFPGWTSHPAGGRIRALYLGQRQAANKCRTIAFVQACCVYRPYILFPLFMALANSGFIQTCHHRH